ncbi:hypothetical protein F511_10166 [Dorcoceras hygrometricum]|uniref:Uncharacterized protein n=1 Tax=Dorcoceras hygrometricum TaxID=472368 RepID=A0A2Z7B1J9_9LAMI|nr:hypothetical protein F511_10166 [Dorcoceras hygrometricum]
MLIAPQQQNVHQQIVQQLFAQLLSFLRQLLSSTAIRLTLRSKAVHSAVGFLRSIVHQLFAYSSLRTTADMFSLCCTNNFCNSSNSFYSTFDQLLLLESTSDSIFCLHLQTSTVRDATNSKYSWTSSIQFGLKVNWSKILFGVLKEMVDRTQKKAKGYAAQICALLKSNPVITFGEAVPFPTSKVLSIKTVHTYIAMNHTIDARGQSDEPGMAPVAIVKRKSKSKKTSETTGETPVEVITEVVSNKRPSVESDELVVPKKRRTTKSKASSSKASLDIVNVAQDVVPLQIVEPTPAATAEKSLLPKRKSKKRRLLNVHQQIVQQLFAQLLSFLRRLLSSTVVRLTLRSTAVHSAVASVIVPTASIPHLISCSSWHRRLIPSSACIFRLILYATQLTASSAGLPSGSATPADPFVVSTAGLDFCLQQLIACD